MAETPIHRDNMIDLLDVLKVRYGAEPMVYVSANMLLYDVPGNNRKQVSPDVFVVKGIPNRERDAYFIWEAGKAPDVIFECTSLSTKKEDLETKFRLYQNVLKVPEYFLFDPKGEYLKPSLQGFRLVEGCYRPIEAEGGRLPSVELGLHLERVGRKLRLYDPATGRWAPTAAEVERERADAERQRAEEQQRRADAERQRLEAEVQVAAERSQQAEAERARLERKLAELRRRLGPDSTSAPPG